ncbi:MAG: stage II sporulation protein D [Firmicutes bacterium]|nr:stage II sporulation protein D [Bacillota bacterium]
MKKYVISTAVFVFLSVFALPSAVVMINGRDEEKNDEIRSEVATSGEVPLEVINEVDYADKIDKYEEMTKNKEDNAFEAYIRGVVAAEMPINFETEALKAQAVAARTYAIRNSKDIYNIDPNSLGQAYISVDTMRANWGNDFESNYAKLCEAVAGTRGLIMVYDDEPILAAFYSTSAGVTELAENVWGSSLPYIKNVESPLDKNAPNYESRASFDYSRAAEILRGYGGNIVGGDSDIVDSIKIEEYTQAGYVKYVSVCGVIIKGTEIRSMFSLRSNYFEIERDGETITFITKGFGHGVGMSQYGAEFMAKEGSTFDEILEHYYSGITIRSY